MSKFLQSVVVLGTALMLSLTMSAQQLTNANFEDWSGAAFDGKVQPKGWNASNVEQFGFKFNFAHKEDGHNGGSSMMVQDQAVGAAGITETSPGYFSLGQPWAYVPGLTSVGQATAGTSGGILWTYRPDSMSVWIRRTGNNTDKEDFYLLYYAWEKDAKGTAYKGKNGNCTPYTQTNEESDVRIALNGNECSTQTAGDQISEGMWREKATYNEWTNIRVPIYYLNSNKSKWMNIIFSASNYPNFRANSGLYEGNSLYVDDVELIYSSKIQTLLVDGMTWNGFDPNSSDVQVYALGESATAVPTITAKRGAGSLTNAKGTTKTFPGRFLEEGANKEMTIQYGDLENTPTVITVRAEDGSSTTVYKIQFKRAASSNAKLAGISYILDGQETAIADFSPTASNYTIALPYGTTDVPQISFTLQENGQTATVTQATSLQGQAVIHVTAPNGTDTRNYTVSFTIAELADNNLAGIKVNNNDLPGFNPTQSNYKVSLPVGTQTLTVVPVKKYDGQTVVVTPATMPTGTAIDGTVVEISVTTPGNSTPRKYRLTIKLEASSYSYLANLTITGEQILKCNPHIPEDSTVIEFTPENMIYYVTLKMGTTQLPTIVATKGDEYQSAPIVDTSAGLDGITRVTATAGNGDQSVYKIYFSTEKSSNSKLAGIQIDGEALADFDADVTSYTVSLPVGTTTLPTITWTPGDQYQNIEIVQGSLSTKTRITVTAGDGSMTVYQIGFSVNSYTDNTLKSLSVEGYEIDFNPEQLSYTVNLLKGTTVRPAVLYEAQAAAPLQTVTVRDFDGLTGDYKITVRPQSGASRTYVITFQLNKSHNALLAGIKIGETPIDTFSADLFDYVDSLPEGVSAIPKVTPIKAESTQRIQNVLEGTKQVITVTAEDGYVRVYTIQFVLRISTNAKLNMIYLDGKALADFDPTVPRYEHCYLTGATCPVITVDANPGQQVTITAPYSTGEAKIQVMAGGAVNEYVLIFLERKKESTQLASITKDGVEIDGFEPTKADYKTTYSKTRPVIVGVPAYPEQKVSETLWADSVAWIYVTDTLGNKDAYTVTCRRLLSPKNQLKAIYADGTILPGFKSDSTEYAFELNQDEPYPVITYREDDDAQVLFFGQIAQGVWEIKVAAEDGSMSTYRVTYTVKQYTDVKLDDLQVEGDLITYDEDTKEYSGGELGEGEALPRVTAKARRGQTVMVYDEDDRTQRVVVRAENGDSTAYVIKYTRALNDNTQLDSLYIDGKRLLAFHPDTLHYTYTLERGTEAVPNVFAFGHVDNQTIVTTFGRPNEATTVLVTSQKGSTRTYTIDFPIRKSTNAALKSLRINNEEKDVNTTEYVFDVPFGTNTTYPVVFTKDEGQLIEYIDAPITGVTKIIVRPEEGEPRTYTISYNILQPTKENIIPNVVYKYRANGTTTEANIAPVVGDNIIDLPFGTDSFYIVQVDTNYREQTYLLYDGGIRRGAKIVAIANRAGEKDVTYTFTPRMPEIDTIGKLKELKFQDVLVPNFRPDVYNYMINVSAEPVKADFTFTKYNPTDNVEKSEINSKNKQITITVDGGKTYSVCWFYNEDKDPFDFTATWVKAEQGAGFKPSDKWKVMADYTWGYDFSLIGYHIPYTAGKEVSRYGSNGVMLSTLRQGALRQSLPGMMSLSEWSTHKIDENGGSRTAISQTAADGVQFRNTPEWLKFEYNTMQKNDISAWSIKLYMGDGTTQNLSTFSGVYDDSHLNELYENQMLEISYPEGNVVTNTLNAILNSCGTEQAGDMNGYSKNQYADLVLQNMHLAYNTELDAAYVNGAATTKNGNTFTYNVPADAAIIAKPALTFDCHVHDQMQTIEWLNDGEWVNGKLTARVINYGENSLDSTHYFVVLQRAPQTTFAHKAVFNGTYDKTIKHTTDADSVFITKPYGDKTIPTLTITPNNIHQRFAMLKDGNTITVVVTNELGMDSTTVYVFAEETSNSTALQEFGRKDAGTMEVDGTNYTVVENEMPELEWTKEHVGQTVHTTYTADGATVVITALDGKTTATLNVTRNTPVVYVKATMESFSSNVPAELKDNTEVTAPKPAGVVSFTRASAAAAVVFTQTPDSMLWHVTGSTNDSTYTLRYPAEASSNANLQAILINGELMDGFYEGTYEYDAPVYADSTAIVEAIGAEPEQTIHLQMNNVEGGIHYDVAVTAADGVASHTYKFDVTKPKSAINTLAAIRCDDKLITGFHPDSLTYEVIVPVAKYKKEQPKMPSITYEAGQKGQKITMAPSLVFGTATTIEVMSETGVSLEYSVTVRAQKSSCVDLSGITVNGALLEDFEPGRRNYSVSLKDTNVVIAYTSEDNFQTYTKDVVCVEQGKKYLYGVTVKAENGLDSARYVIDVYIERMSDDTQLANITLDGQQIIDYERGMNPKQIPFDPGTNRYTINLHPDSTNLPIVRAELATENQIVQITKQSGDTVLLEVSVKDNLTKKNTYSLFFNRPKSTNADLAMIYINGDTLNYLDGEELRPFQPTKYVYTVRLKEGIHELPQVAYDYDRKQSVDTIWDAANDQIQIHVSAEDTSVVNSYLVVFQFTRSAADTLLAIYADGVELPDFSPSKLHYNDTLEVGRKNFPELSWQEKDDYQTIQLDTVSYSADGSQLVRSITVTAENGHSKSYIITYVIRKSGLATLANLLVDSKPLAGFDPNVDNYNYELTAEQATALEGALPSVEVVEGDEWQTVLITQAPDTLNEKTLGQMSIITVTAASGATMRYTIHYPVALSTDAKLNMILLEGKPLSNFDSERYNYRVEIDNTSAVPVVSVIKKEEAQNYEIRVMDDTVRIVVKAESKLDSAAYTLIFERVLSGNTKLNNIILTDQAGAYVTPNQFRFNPAWDSYTIDLNWEPGQVKDSLLPTMEFDLADTLQSVRVEQTELEDGSIQVEIIVTAANKDEGSYFITFKFTKPGDNTLKALFLNGVALPDFSPMELEYTYQHPYGTDEADYFTPAQLSYILSDSLATAVDSINDNHTLFVTVTAQNGKQRVYAINQVTGEDDNADLAWIAVDGDLIQDFDPNVTFYTYDVYKGAATPSITAEQASPNASAPTVDDISKLGDTCNIRVKAANGDVKVYQVYIRETLDKGLEASANDVIIKRIPGTAQYFVASIRSGVKFALFDLNRQVLLDAQAIPEANLNYAEVYKDTQDKDVLGDVVNMAEGLIVNVDLGKPYIYVFWYNNKKVKSGVIIAQ